MCMHVCTYTYACMCTRACLSLWVYISTCVCMFIYGAQLQQATAKPQLSVAPTASWPCWELGTVAKQGCSTGAADREHSPFSSSSWVSRHLSLFVHLSPAPQGLVVQCWGDRLGRDGRAALPTSTSGRSHAHMQGLGASHCAENLNEGHLS